ncbi:MAG: decaprenyl-phosphate phosphoribosyltransferase [Deltaproteobacteria bacterium]|nr:MAG: decaprenyl-phosphate phosphoribosyltransferase [Deltaproteobacteria bacterium]
MFLPVVRLLRLHQWLKNLMMFFPPLLAGHYLWLVEPGRWWGAFLAFCFASSGVYILNDIHDREQDRNHPVKRSRPIAAGSVPVGVAVVLALVLFSLAGALVLGAPVQAKICLGGYLLLSAGYTLYLKSQPVFDLFCIAGGFLLRLLYGGAVFGVIISQWLFLSVLFLALFISAGKRRSELALQGESGSGASCRPVLARYSPAFLDGVMFMSGTSALVTYTMYVVNRTSLIYTVPLCCFGLLRYLMCAQAGRAGDPTLVLMKDSVLFVVGVLWALLLGWDIYH